MDDIRQGLRFLCSQSMPQQEKKEDEEKRPQSPRRKWRWFGILIAVVVCLFLI